MGPSAERITAFERLETVPATRVFAALDALGLGRREGEVLLVIAGGCSNAEAAAALGVSPLTIKKHLEHIYAKLGVGTRSAAVARLLREIGLGALFAPRHA